MSGDANAPLAHILVLTHRRVCEVILDGKGSFVMKQEKYKVYV